jgi:hypothetical protein
MSILFSILPIALLLSLGALAFDDPMPLEARS